MNITSDIKSVTYLKSKAADLLNQINKNPSPCHNNTEWRTKSCASRS